MIDQSTVFFLLNKTNTFFQNKILLTEIFGMVVCKRAASM